MDEVGERGGGDVEIEGLLQGGARSEGVDFEGVGGGRGLVVVVQEVEEEVEAGGAACGGDTAAAAGADLIRRRCGRCRQLKSSRILVYYSSSVPWM